MRVSAWADDRVITIRYDPTGLAWAHVTEHPVVLWNIEETGAVPIIVVGLSPRAPDTGSVESPQWAELMPSNMVLVPGGWRGDLSDFLGWIATNGGASRRITADFTGPQTVNTWRAWASANRELVREAAVRPLFFVKVSGLSARISAI